MDHGVQNGEFVIQKSKIGILVVLADSIDVLTQSTNVLPRSVDVLT
jgi:hypothetical protein